MKVDTIHHGSDGWAGLHAGNFAVTAASSCMCDSSSGNGNLLSVEQAQRIARGLVENPAQTDLVSIPDALNRIVAEDVFAPLPMPFFDNSAMDGFAIQIGQSAGEGPHRYVVQGESAAGVRNEDCFDPLCAVKINTGAPVPAGFDCVIPHELCRPSGDGIEIDEMPAKGSNIRYQGSDMTAGACLVSKGLKLQAHHVGLLSANGFSSISVLRRPRIAVVSTGDELASPGQALKPGQIFDCNKPMLIALIAGLGLSATDLGALPDDPSETRRFFEEQQDRFDLIVTTGSVSVGNRDFLKPSFEAAGGSIKSWRVAVKPGKPVMFGTLGKTVLTALPGNPFAVFVGFCLFVKPQIARLSGWAGETPRWQTGRANFVWQRKAGRAEVFPVSRAKDQANGAVVLDRLGNSVSATLYPLRQADGLAIVPADCNLVRQGDEISWQPFC